MFDVLPHKQEAAPELLAFLQSQNAQGAFSAQTSDLVARLTHTLAPQPSMLASSGHGSALGMSLCSSTINTQPNPPLLFLDYATPPPEQPSTHMRHTRINSLNRPHSSSTGNTPALDQDQYTGAFIYPIT